MSNSPLCNLLKNPTTAGDCISIIDSSYKKKSLSLLLCE